VRPPAPAPHSSVVLRHGGGWVRVFVSGSWREGSKVGGLRVSGGGCRHRGGGGSRVAR
jgi:hypothetical protein